ncbi:MAG: hypothetical protein HOP11_12145 [Saprospiraceae bacterium]|nr:hypothetical protein [Saprospiraceae bacterium]
MMNQFILFVIVLILSSCNNGIYFSVKNDSENEIFNVKFYTSEKVKVLNLGSIKSGAKKAGHLNMWRNRIDGAYTIEYRNSDNKTILHSNGYYTNGVRLIKVLR